MLGGAALVRRRAAHAARSRRRSTAALTLLGASTALAAYTALSITWSLSPGDSWLEANRTFAYVAAFAGALALVRLVPRALGGGAERDRARLRAASAGGRCRPRSSPRRSRPTRRSPACASRSATGTRSG